MREYSFTDFNASSTVLQNVDMIYNDLIESDGIQFKMLMNDILGERQLALQASELADSRANRGELAVRSKGELDEVEGLMARVQLARNRKDKRRLLAEYNQR